MRAEGFGSPRRGRNDAEVEGGPLLIEDLHPLGVFVLVPFAADPEPGAGQVLPIRSMITGEASQRTALPVPVEKREPAVCDPIPQADPGQQVTDMDVDPEFAVELPEFHLPEPHPIPVASPGVGVVDSRRARSNRSCPMRRHQRRMPNRTPTEDRGSRRTLRHSVRGRPRPVPGPRSRAPNLVELSPLGRRAHPPFLKFPARSVCFRVHGDLRLPGGAELFHLLMDMRESRIPVGMTVPFLRPGLGWKGTADCARPLQHPGAGRRISPLLHPCLTRSSL